MRAVDADEVINKLTETQYAVKQEGDVFHHGVSEGLNYAMTVIGGTLTLKTVKKGKWLETDKNGFRDVYCSVCGCSAYRDEYLNDYIRFVHCPCCGAKMDMDVPCKWGFGSDGWFVTY